MDTILKQSLQTAADCVANDGVIAYPTDTVFGFGCNPFSETAVKKIFQIKLRQPPTKKNHKEATDHQQKGLIILAAEATQLTDFIDSKWVKWLSEQHPSEPTTFIIPCQPQVPSWITGHRSTLAVRITNEAISRALCLKTGAIVSTSANLKGQSPLMDSADFLNTFKIQPDYVVPAKIHTANKSSLIIDAISGKILRS